MRKILLTILFIVLVVALFYKSPFSAMYNYNKARALYNQRQYEQSLPYFEKSLFADPKGILARFFYVLALSKSEPKYSIQKKLFEMANSKIEDEASKYAKSQTMYLRYKLLDGIENNYIFNAAMGSDILRWDIRSFPLSVYIDSPNSVPPYYIESINRAMNLWSSRTNFVKFKQAQNPLDADILIRFENTPNDLCKGGICKYAIAHTEPQIDKNKILKQMDLTFYKTNPRKENFTSREVFNTALHELGHTLGIMGHSDNPNDLMYSMKESDFDIFAFMRTEEHSLTARDLKTLVLLYRIEPTISNVKNLHSENFYYAPLILGNDDVRLQKKLNEYKKYTQTYPNMAAGYINLASVYVDLGDFDSALREINKAEQLANTKDEQFLVHYDRAIIYYNQQKYSSALEAAQHAQSIKNENNVQELIKDIEKIK